MAVGRVTVGDAWVDLHADGGGLRDEIRRAVNDSSSGQKFTIPMSVDSRGLRDEVNRAMRDANAGQKFTLPVSVDSRSLRAELRRAVNEASDGSKFTIPVSVNSRGLRAELKRALKDASDGDNVSIPVHINSKGLRAELKRALAEASLGQHIDVEVHINRSKLDALGNEIAKLGGGVGQRFGEEFAKHNDPDQNGKVSNRYKGLRKALTDAGDIKIPFMNPFGAVLAGAAALLPVLVHLGSSLTLASSSLAALAPAAIIGAGAMALIGSAIKKPGPELQAAEGHWKGLVDQWSRAGLQHGMTDALNRMQGQLPVVNKAMYGLSDSLGYVVHRLGEVASSSRFGAQLANIFGNGNKAVHTMGDTMANLLRIFMSISSAASSILPRFADWTSKITEKLATMTEQGERTGKLGAFFKRAADEMADWGKAIGHVASALFNIFRVGSQGAGDMGKKVLDLTKKFDDWSKSVAGQNEIRKFFDFLRNINWGAVIKGAAALYGLQKALTAAGGAMKITEGIMKMFGATSLATPVGIVVAAIAALAVGFVILYAKCKPFHDWVNSKLLPGLKELWGHISAKLVPILKDLGHFLSTQIVPMVKSVIAIFQQHKAQLEIVAKVIGVILLGALKLAVLEWKLVAYVLIQIVGTAIKAVVFAIAGIVVAVKAMVTWGKWLYDQWINVWHHIHDDTIKWASDAVNWVRVHVQQWVSDLVNFVKWLWDHFVDVIHHIRDDVINWFNDVINWVTTHVHQWVNDIVSWAHWLWDHFVDVIHHIRDDVINWFNDVINWVTTHVHQWVNDIVSWAHWLWDHVVDIIHRMHDDMINWFHDVIDWIKTHVEEWVNWVHQKVIWLHDKMFDVFHQIHDDVINWIHNAVDWVKTHVDEWGNWIHDKINWIHDRWAEVWTKIGQAPGKAIHKAVVWVTDRINGLIKLLNDGIGAVNKFTSFVGITIPTVPNISAPSDGSDGDQSIPGLAAGGWAGALRRASGGLLSGPGSPTSDSIHAMLSTEEYVVNAKAVKALGVHNLDYMNATGKVPVPGSFREGGMASAVAPAAPSVTIHMADGGAVGKVQEIQAWIRQQVGKPYVMGAAGPSAWDCSGLVGAVRKLVSGQQPNGRIFDTSNEAPFFTPGFGGVNDLNVGWVGGSGGDGHTVGSIGGLNFEATPPRVLVGNVNMTPGNPYFKNKGHATLGQGTPFAGGGAGGGGGGGLADMIAALLAQVDAAVGSIKKAWASVLTNIGDTPQFNAVWQNIMKKVPDAIKDKLTAAANAQGAAGGGGPNSGSPGSAAVEKQAYDTAKGMGADNKAILALFEAGFVESNFQNIQKAVDHDSLGFLQQRPSAGWPDPLNVPTATRSFISKAMAAEKAGKGIGSPGSLAQAVQVSAFPSRYDQESGRATAALKALGAPGFAAGGAIGGEHGVDKNLIWASRGERMLTPEQNKDYESGANGAEFYVGGDLNVTISATDIKQMKDVGDFFDGLKTAARAGSAKTRSPAR